RCWHLPLAGTPGADSPARKGDSADRLLFVNENQIVPEASFPARLPIESALKPPCPACDVPPEPTRVCSLVVEPASTGHESPQTSCGRAQLAGGATPVPQQLKAIVNPADGKRVSLPWPIYC